MSSALYACGHLWFTGQIPPQADRGTQEAGFDCGSEQLRRFTSGVLLFKNHLSLKPHGNEFSSHFPLRWWYGGWPPSA